MPSPTIILGLLLALAVAGDALLAKLYVGAKQDVARVQQAYDSFKAQVKVEGEEAQKKAAAQEMSDKLRKDTADAENKAAVASLTADIAKLRAAARSSPGGGGLSAPPTSPSSPTRTCFDPAKLSGALQSLDEGLLGILESGSRAVVDLDNAKAWAQGKIAP